METNISKTGNGYQPKTATIHGLQKELSSFREITTANHAYINGLLLANANIPLLDTPPPQIESNTRKSMINTTVMTNFTGKREDQTSTLVKFLIGNVRKIGRLTGTR